MAYDQNSKEYLDKMLTEIEQQAQWANAEMKRLLAENRLLRAANLELNLKVHNLRYFLRTLTQKDELN